MAAFLYVFVLDLFLYQVKSELVQLKSYKERLQHLKDFWNKSENVIKLF